MFLMTDHQQIIENGHPAYLTAGKLYKVIAVDPYSDNYHILDDTDYPICVPVNRPSGHLNDTGVFKIYNEPATQADDKELIQMLVKALEAYEAADGELLFSIGGQVRENARKAIAAAKGSA